MINNDDDQTVDLESKFCGQVFRKNYFPNGKMAKTCFETNCKNLKVERMWDGAVVTNGRCYTEYGVSVDSKENDTKTMETCHNLGCF